MPSKLLVVEDDLGLQKQLKWALKSDYELLLASNREQAIGLFMKHNPAVVVHDLGLPPDQNGVDEGKMSINAMLNHNPRAKILIMTGKGDQSDAIELIRSGAHDFFNKPVKLDTLKTVIERAFYLNSLEIDSSHKNIAANELEPNMLLPGLVGKSQSMRDVARQVSKVANTIASVLLNGESGTGKELVARAIHSMSTRSKAPFVAINCAAIPENLLESELFGYEKGAFTGATSRSLGKIEAANNGTLFLDEIGDMAYDLQSKILRFLEQKSIHRLGSNKEIPVDVRVISATHQNLVEKIELKEFRHDLYYRINEIEIMLPALKNRSEDLPYIANYLLHKSSIAHDKPELSFGEGVLAAMQACKWEGNIRQLANIINKAVIMSEDNVLTSESFNLPFTLDDSRGTFKLEKMTLKDAKNMLEANLVQNALNEHNNNVQQAAAMLGVSRQRVYEIMKKNAIKESS